MFQKQRHI